MDAHFPLGVNPKAENGVNKEYQRNYWDKLMHGRYCKKETEKTECRRCGRKYK